MGDDDPALDVGPGVGVDVLLLHHVAVPDVDHGRFGRPGGCAQEVVAVAERPIAERHGRLGGIDGAPRRPEALEVAALVAAGLQPERLEPGGEVAGGHVEPSRGRVAAFELVGGDERQVGAQPGDVDLVGTARPCPALPGGRYEVDRRHGQARRQSDDKGGGGKDAETAAHAISSFAQACEALPCRAVPDHGRLPSAGVD
jgi:hypothetical protein